MCVVLVCPEKVRPSIETLRLCERANPHGGGIAWRNNGAVEWLKTNDLAEIDKLARKIPGEIVIHFRIASVGGVCDALRHPFPITRRAQLDPRGRTGAVLFQNGTWGGYREALEFALSEGHLIPQDEMSDTRAAAFLCSLYGHKFLKKCRPSRWVYFSAKETIRYGDWCKREGIFYSNLYWLPPAPPKRSETFSERSKDNGGYKTKLDQELELWDLGGQRSYWDYLNRVTPKPARKTWTCDECGHEVDNIHRYCKCGNERKDAKG